PPGCKRPGRTRRFDVPDFVADGRRQLCRRRASFDDGFDLGGFAEQWRAGTELVDHRRHLGAKHAANIGPGVGADDRYRNAVASERGKNIRDPREYADLLDIACRDLAQLSDDEWQFPGGNAEIGEDFPGGAAAQHFALFGRNLAKSIVPRQLVQRVAEPRGTVGDGAVEIENGEVAVSHA